MKGLHVKVEFVDYQHVMYIDRQMRFVQYPIKLT